MVTIDNTNFKNNIEKFGIEEKDKKFWKLLK